MSWRNDPAQRKAYYAAWYQKNRHTVAKRSAKWWDAHPGASKVYNAKYRSAHPDRRRTSQAKWRVAHPEACYQHAQNHVHRRLSNGGSHTLSQWHALLEAHDYKCFYHKDLYGSELILTKKTATRDHVVPVSKEIGRASCRERVYVLV